MDEKQLISILRAAADFAESQISKGILCTVMITRFGFEICASLGRGESRLSINKIVSYEEVLNQQGAMNVIKYHIDDAIARLTEAERNREAKNGAA